MVCDPGESDVDIGIPAVMLPLDAGTSLIEFLRNSSAGMLIIFPFLLVHLGGGIGGGGVWRGMQVRYLLVVVLLFIVESIHVDVFPHL